MTEAPQQQPVDPKALARKNAISAIVHALIAIGFFVAFFIAQGMRS